MRKWAVWIVLFYGLMLVVLTFPLTLATFISWSDFKSLKSFLDFLDDQPILFDSWMYWLVIVVMMAAEAVLLLIPVDLSIGRPVKKQPVILTILASALMMGVLAGGAGLTIAELIKSDALNKPMQIFCWAAGALWVFWAWIFWRWMKKLEPKLFLEKFCRSLFRGSALELLVAVPAHIFVRQRNDCCAGAGTFFGLACGLAVMLFSFGPGIFFLYAARVDTLGRKIS